MRQAIEEGFILDVLQNYTSYKVAFNLAHEGKTISEVDKAASHEGHHGLGAAARLQHRAARRRSWWSISGSTSPTCSAARPRRWW
jgi:hypothetical protein